MVVVTAKPADRADWAVVPVGQRFIAAVAEHNCVPGEDVLGTVDVIDWPYTVQHSPADGAATLSVAYTYSWYDTPALGTLIAATTVQVVAGTAADVILANLGPYLVVTASPLPGAGTARVGGSWQVASARGFWPVAVPAHLDNAAVGAGATAAAFGAPTVNGSGVLTVTSTATAWTWRLDVLQTDGTLLPLAFGRKTAAGDDQVSIPMPAASVQVSVTNLGAAPANFSYALSVAPG